MGVPKSRLSMVMIDVFVTSGYVVLVKSSFHVMHVLFVMLPLLSKQ